jgi:hypothetical protein
MSLKVGQSLVAIIGLALAGVVGYQVGKSKGQEEREALQREILRMQAIALRRNAEVQRLRAYIAVVDAEVHALGLQHEQLDQFLDWLAEHHPTVLVRYRSRQQAEVKLAVLEEQSSTEQWIARQRYVQLRQQFPEEAAKLSIDECRFLS